MEEAAKQPNVLMKTDLPLPLFIRGKVRDTYDLGNHLLIIATDRISAFDVVLPCGIPYKGKVLNMLSNFWFRHTKEIIPNHLMEVVEEGHCLDSYIPTEKRFACPDYLAGRSVIVKKMKRIPIECVVRGYISGSAWAEYAEKGTVAGEKMHKGLLESQELEHPIYTPTTKAEAGHDLPISKEEIVKIVGPHVAQEMEEKSLALYNYAREYARARGIIIADTKFEFGMDNGKLALIDEALTPDSSRFWDVALYKVGQPQPSLDKQPIRDWLASSGWNKEPPAPMLPDEVIAAASKGYIRAYEMITERKLSLEAEEI